MSPGLGAAMTGLAWAAGIGVPILAAALLLAFGDHEPSGQLIGMLGLATAIGGVLAVQATLRIRERVDQTRAEVMARLRHARSAEEARHAVRIAAVFAGDPAYSEQAEKLSDAAILALCRDIADRNDDSRRRGGGSHSHRGRGLR